jgi:tRNA 2-thiouridine synthesizing protein A
MCSTLNTKGLNCPLPVLKTKRALKDVPIGACLTVLADDPAAAIDFRHFCNVSGNELVEWSCVDGVFTFVIRRAR